MKKISLTTTLPYVNSDPHIGFALEIVQADIIARWRRKQGDEVFFNTGTDEHGIKIHRKALEAGQDPQAFVDHYAKIFDELKVLLNLSYNSFIRTTDPNHKVAAQEFWKRCADNGDIYKKSYSVKYCVGCELEKTDSELDHGKCPIHPNLEIENINEENYFFKFSKYQEPLLKLYTDRPDFVVPDYRLKEIKTFVAQGLEDFSISRLKEKMPWGVPVPGDDQHVMYVWFDALINYISCLGWPDKKFSEWWPSVQFAGKDNLRQQSAMWQAMLLSAKIEPSKQIVIHGFMTAEGKKISKSLGNTVDPFALVKAYGTDAVRYYLARHVHPFEDSDYTPERFKEAYTADLANDLGNLVSRVTNMIEKYADGKYIVKEVGDEESKAFMKDRFKENYGSSPLRKEYEMSLGKYRYDLALEVVWKQVAAANKVIDDEQPWKKVKEGKNIQVFLNQLATHVLEINDQLKPFMPETSEKITAALTIPVKKAEPLFPRI